MKKLLWLVLSAFFCVALTAEESGAYQVLILGDVHYDRADLHKDPDYGKKNKSHARNLKMWEKATPELLTLAGKCAAAEHTAFVVQLGDIVQGGAGSRELRLRMLEDGYAAVKAYFPNTPLLLVRGNHDVRSSDRPGSDPVDDLAKPPVVDELGVKSYENGCFAIRLGKDLFIAVNDFIPAERIVSFVKKTLDANADARFVFFLTHLPVLPASINQPFWLVPGHLEIAELLETRSSLIFAAHTHFPSMADRITERGSLWQIVVSSMGNTWHPSAIVPPRITSWEEFVKISKTRSKPGSRYNPPRWPEEETRGKYKFGQLFRNSGFVVLKIDDSGYRVEYCIGEGFGVPLMFHTN